MTIQESMGLRIKHLRQEHAMSQTELAEMIGYKDKTAIAKIEAGKVDLPQSKISLFANVLNVSTSYLFGDESEKDIPSRVTGQPSIWEIPVCTIDNATILENDLINALRDLRNISAEESDSLGSIFTRIPSLPKELRDDIYEYAYIAIRKYDKEQMQKNITTETADSPIDDGYFGILEMSDKFLSAMNKANAANERTDIKVTEDMKKHDNDIMDDENFEN